MAAPIPLCDTKGMPRATWLAARAHGPDGSIPFTLGGSDISVIYGINPWKTPLELWMEKTGRITPDDTTNLYQKEMGHLMEPIVAHWYAELTGNELIEDTMMYQHAKYPFALGDLDYRFRQKGTGQIGVFDSKTTTYHKAADWSDSACPPYYELQMRWYLAIMDLELAELGCLWGMNPKNDMAIRPVNRDIPTEDDMFERATAFIDCCRTDTPPVMDDVLPEVAMAGLQRIYLQSQAGLPTIEFGASHEKALRRIAQLQMENSQHDAAVRKNEKEVTALSVQIAALMEDHEHGELILPSEKIIVDYKTRITRRPDSDKLKSDYSAVYQDVLKESCSRKLKASIKPL